MVTKIISGGQTGADRAALDFAIQHNILHGGHCPRGRKAEDGPIPAIYNLRETQSADYTVRTELNVRDADATVVFTRSQKLSRGSRLTVRLADRNKCPCLHLHSGLPFEDAAGQLNRFIIDSRPGVLNVAGSRARGSADVSDFTAQLLSSCLSLFQSK